jgi:hypothetical protein
MKRSFLLLLCSFVPFSAVAQQNELSLTFGGTLTVSAKGTPSCEAILVCPTTPVNVDVNPGFSFSGSFARRFSDLRAASLYAEFPVMATPSRSGPGLFGDSFSSVFFTPSIRAQLVPSAAISPFVSGGFGLAHYSGDGSGDTQWAFQLGGGIDFKTPLPHLGLRVEAHDFLTGRPSILPLANITAGHLQQVYAGAGVVLKF